MEDKDLFIINLFIKKIYIYLNNYSLIYCPIYLISIFIYIIFIYVIFIYIFLIMLNYLFNLLKI